MNPFIETPNSCEASVRPKLPTTEYLEGLHAPPIAFRYTALKADLYLLWDGDGSTVFSRHLDLGQKLRGYFPLEGWEWLTNPIPSNPRSVVHALIQQETLALKKQLFPHGQKKLFTIRLPSPCFTPSLARGCVAVGARPPCKATATSHRTPASLPYHIEDRRNRATLHFEFLRCL